MNKLQSTLIASVLTLSIAAPTFANDMPVTQFNQVEAQSLFETSVKPMELAALSQQEMKETEGAVVQFAIGGAVGFVSYAGQNALSALNTQGSFIKNFQNSWNTNQAIVSTSVGALTGGVGAIGLRTTGITIDYSKTLFLKSSFPQNFINNQIRTFSTDIGIAIKAAAMTSSSIANNIYASWIK